MAVPGFQTFTARDIIVTNRDIRVDAKLGLGTLEEALTVTATAAILQTENAAVQHIANSEQLQTLPTSGRAFQSFMTLMPGVADPNYQQSGGINNPGRTMSLTINGQPATNTVVRLDGITATNQFFESIQSYGPSLEAIETVNVVTSSFDADQGMAGAAAVNVQVKTGTNNFHGSAFEYAVDARWRARNYFLPAGRDKGTSSVNVFGGTLGQPDCARNKVFFFVSDETTRQRKLQRQRSRADRCRQVSCWCHRRIYCEGRIREYRHDYLRPAYRESDDRRRACPVRFRQLRNRLDSRSAIRVSAEVVHSAEPHQPNRSLDVVEAGAADRAGLHEQLFRDQRVRHNVSQDRREDYVQSGAETEPERAHGVPAELGTSLGVLPSVDGSPENPLSQGRVWDSFVDSRSIGATSIFSQNFVVDGSFGYTNTT